LVLLQEYITMHSHLNVKFATAHVTGNTTKQMQQLFCPAVCATSGEVYVTDNSTE